MNCPECDEKFVDYLYSELPPEERRGMEEHLKTCSSCTRQLAQLRFVRSSYQCLKDQEPRSLVHQRILAHARDSNHPGRSSWLAGLIFRPAAATIMVVLLAVGVFSSVRYLTSPATAPLDSASRGKPSVAVELPAARETVPDRQTGVLTRVARTMSGERTAEKPFSLQAGDALSAFELGNFYFSQNDFEKAIASYSIALTMNPRESYTSLIRYQLALSYKKLNDCNSAVQVLDDIQKRFPDYHDMDKVFMMAGDCYLDLKAYDKAETTYANLINKFPDKKPEVADKLETVRKFRRVNLSY